LLFYVLIRVPYIDFVPLWDGFVYDWFARHAALDPLSIEVHNHICFAFMYLVALPARLDAHSPVGMNLFLTLLGLVTVATFYVILDHFLRDRARPAELALYTAVFAFHPTVLSNTFNLNLDQGLLACYLIFLALFLKERYGLAAVACVVLIFTKETALLVVPLVPACVLLADPTKRNLAWLRRCVSVAVVPGLAFLAYALYKTQVRGREIVWGGLGDNSRLTAQLLNLMRCDEKLLVQVVQFFVLNFQWVATAVLLVLATIYILRAHRAVSPAERQLLVFAGLLLTVTLLVLSRFIPYSNARYLLVAFPLFFIVLFALQVLCITRAAPRLLLTGLYLAVFIPSLYRTLDPISRQIFGTFQIGEHQILAMASLGHDSTEYFGRDQLVYNLEFMKLHYLTDHALRDLKPKPTTHVLLARGAHFGVMVHLRSKDYRRSLSWNHTFLPIYETVPEFLEKHPAAQEAYYFEFPNVDNSRELLLLAEHFTGQVRYVWEMDGYKLQVTKFHRNPRARRWVEPSASLTTATGE